jgi:hypothetical protein
MCETNVQIPKITMQSKTVKDIVSQEPSVLLNYESHQLPRQDQLLYAVVVH